jgi:hypothetical protein
MGVVINELEVVEDGREGEARSVPGAGAKGAAAGGGKKADAAEELRRALRVLAERRARVIAH